MENKQTSNWVLMPMETSEIWNKQKMLKSRNKLQLMKIDKYPVLFWDKCANSLETGWIETRSDANVLGVLLDDQEA